MKIYPNYYHEEVSKIWLDYYHELTGKTDKPHYSDDGCLLHWISEYSRMSQTDILHICYEVGFAAGSRQDNKKTAQAFVVPEQLSALYGAKTKPIFLL